MWSSRRRGCTRTSRPASCGPPLTVVRVLVCNMQHQPTHNTLSFIHTHTYIYITPLPTQPLIFTWRCSLLGSCLGALVLSHGSIDLYCVCGLDDGDVVDKVKGGSITLHGMAGKQLQPRFQRVVLVRPTYSTARWSSINRDSPPPTHPHARKANNKQAKTTTTTTSSSKPQTATQT
jgi:hypothetical protein